jgi:hypothetical protein
MEAGEAMTATAEQIRLRIGEYLETGGLFNPEMMDHRKVGALLLDTRLVLNALLKEREELCNASTDEGYVLELETKLAEAQREIERLLAERPFPPDWIAVSCADFDKHTARAETAEAKVEELRGYEQECGRFSAANEELHQQVEELTRQVEASYSWMTDRENELRQQLAVAQGQLASAIDSAAISGASRERQEAEAQAEEAMSSDEKRSAVYHRQMLEPSRERDMLREDNRRLREAAESLCRSVDTLEGIETPYPIAMGLARSCKALRAVLAAPAQAPGRVPEGWMPALTESVGSNTGDVRRVVPPVAQAPAAAPSLEKLVAIDEELVSTLQEIAELVKPAADEPKPSGASFSGDPGSSSAAGGTWGLSGGTDPEAGG